MLHAYNATLRARCIRSLLVRHTGRVVLLLWKRLRCTCLSVFSSNGGRGCVSLAVLSLCGTMRAGSHVWQTQYKDPQAWVTSQRSKGEHHPNWCMTTLRKKTRGLKSRMQCVKLPTAASLSHLIDNLVTPKPGPTVVRTLSQTGMTSLISQKHLCFVWCQRWDYTHNQCKIDVKIKKYHKIHPINEQFFLTTASINQ